MKYTTNFSLVMRLPNKHAQVIALAIASRATAFYMGADRSDVDLAYQGEQFPAVLMQYVDGWIFNVEENNPCDPESAKDLAEIWIYSDDGGVVAAIAFIRYLLKRFDPHRWVGFEWSHDCSVPCTNAYGGGAVVVTATGCEIMSTVAWLKDQTTTRSHLLRSNR